MNQKNQKIALVVFSLIMGSVVMFLLSIVFPFHGSITADELRTSLIENPKDWKYHGHYDKNFIKWQIAEAVLLNEKEKIGISVGIFSGDEKEAMFGNKIGSPIITYFRLNLFKRSDYMEINNKHLKLMIVQLTDPYRQLVKELKQNERDLQLAKLTAEYWEGVRDSLEKEAAQLTEVEREQKVLLENKKRRIKL